jgi:DNA-binding transcriptional MocR family regulator
MLIPIERGAREPVAKQIFQYLRRAIDAGRLRPGTKLEPIRVLARELGVNRETVAAAYHELEIVGLTESTVGRGTFVLARPGATGDGGGNAARRAPAELPFVPMFSRRSTALATAAAGRVDYGATADAVRLERLIPDASLVPQAEFRKALNRALIKSGASIYDYGDPRGHEKLRRVLVERFARSGIQCDADEVLVTAGSTQGFAIAATVLCDPGDAVVVESPTYPWACASLVSLGLRVLPVPVRDDGLDLDQLDAVLARGDVHLVYTMPTFHNPLGITTSLAHRKRLLEICGRHGVAVLEDDFEKDLRVRGRGAPPLRALDARGLVIYLGTFSKALFPAARVGWLVAPRRVADTALAVKRTIDITTSTLMQAGLAQFLAEGSYDRHLRRVVREMGARLAAAERALETHLPPGSRFTRPEGGYVLWVTLPEPIDSFALLAEARRAGVVYAPGQIFMPEEQRSSSLRLSVAQASAAQIERGIRTLGEVARAALQRAGRRTAARAAAVHV